MCFIKFCFAAIHFGIRSSSMASGYKMEILDLWYWMRQSAIDSEQILKVFAEYGLSVLSEGWSVFWYCSSFVASHSDNRVDQGNCRWLTCN